MGFARAPEEDGVLNFVNSFLGSQLSIRYRTVRSSPAPVMHEAWGLRPGRDPFDTPLNRVDVDEVVDVDVDSRHLTVCRPPSPLRLVHP